MKGVGRVVVVVVFSGGGGGGGVGSGGGDSSSQCTANYDGRVVAMIVVMITTVTIQKGLFKITRLFLDFIISFNAKE